MKLENEKKHCRKIKFGFVFFLNLALLCSSALAQFPIVTNLNDVAALASGNWTNYWMARILPPGPMIFRNDLGPVEFVNGFDTNFLAGIAGGAITNSTAVLFQIEVAESNSSPRMRYFCNVQGGIVYTAAPPSGYSVGQWITNVYGATPGYLTGSDLAQWNSDRDPNRSHVLLHLLSTNDVPAYLAWLTNSVETGSSSGDTNTPSVLSICSNKIAFVSVKNGGNSGNLSLYLHAPTNTPNLEVYKTTNLLASHGWKFVGTLPHSIDPLPCNILNAEPGTYFAIGDPAIDSDGDGIPDIEEVLIYGTDPYNADSDGDGLTDFEEIMRYGTSPLNADTDGDGLSDSAEIAAGTNPNKTDTDGDGLSDYDEINIYFTNPLDRDTDHDGLSDYDEVMTYHTYPRYADTDFDGLSDSNEVARGTNPHSADSDSDGIDDYYEVNPSGTRHWDPLDPATASQDDDSDGISNLTAYQWCVNPDDGTGISYNQNLITRGPGSNAIRRVDAVNFQLAVGDWGQNTSIVRVRPYRNSPTNLLPQLLFHSSPSGFYINGTAASSMANPIQISAQSNAVEFRITCDNTALGTNISFSLTNNIGVAGSDCLATFYSPKLTKVLFDGPQMYTNVNFGTTGVLHMGMSSDANANRVYMIPSQTPTGGNGIPNLYWTDWLLVKVTGDGAEQTNSTLNEWDYRSAYGSHDYRESHGIKLTQPGIYKFEVGFDLNGDGILQPEEVQETCKVCALTVTKEHDLWWFNGEDPGGGYFINAELWTTPSSGWDTPLTWVAAAGSSKVNLQIGTNVSKNVTAPSTNEFYVEVLSLAQSSATNDVSIELRIAGTILETTKLTVRSVGAPALVSGYPTDAVNILGYITTYRFQMCDQFKVNLPYDIPINESFSSWVNDYWLNSWLSTPPNGEMTSATMFSDKYGGNQVGIPSPVNPGDPDATNKVKHATQYYRAGSTNIGSGVLFKQHTIQIYQGMARQL